MHDDGSRTSALAETVAGLPYGVRRAGAVEVAAARMLLPVVLATRPRPLVFAAACDTPPRVLGAAALAPGAAAARFAVRVAGPYRRAGVGRDLVEAIVREARGLGVTALLPWIPVGEGSGEARFLERLGFAVANRLLHFEARGALLVPLLRALRDRLVAAGRVPAGARLVALREAPRDRVLALCRRFLPVLPGPLAEALEGRGAAACSEDSVVLLVEDEVRGALLYRIEEDVLRVDGRVVHPSLRGTWANTLLMAACAEHALATGASRLRFSARNDMVDTMKLARRCRAVPISEELLYELDLGRPERRRLGP